MYKVNDSEFDTLTEAMDFAKELNEYVTITGNGIEIIGIFGADAVVEGTLPNGLHYTWKKRRI